MKEKRRIKLKDRELIELGRKLSGIRMLLGDLAFVRERAKREFWTKLWALYPKLPKYDIRFDHFTEELIVLKKDC